jgi:hypothetical protein
MIQYSAFEVWNSSELGDLKCRFYLPVNTQESGLHLKYIIIKTSMWNRVGSPNYAAGFIMYTCKVESI